MNNIRKQILWIIVVLLISTTPSFAYYNPKTGRFLQRDPIGERDGICIVYFADTGSPKFKKTKIRNQYTDGASLYEYVKSNPVIKRDIWGLECLCGANVTDMLIDHFNAFISQSEGDLPWWPSSGIKELQDYARENGVTIQSAVNAIKGCGNTAECMGTVTICGKCFSGYHLAHFLVMNYIAQSYGWGGAYGAGIWNEGDRKAIEADRAADLAVNKVALCISSKMHASYYETSGLNIIHHELNLLTKEELCECIKNADMDKIGQKPPFAGNTIGYAKKCFPCVVKPGKVYLRLPPYDL